MISWQTVSADPPRRAERDTVGAAAHGVGTEKRDVDSGGQDGETCVIPVRHTQALSA
jgi:hypothetical protein